MKSNRNAYHVEPFPRIREGAIDLLRAAHGKHMIHALIEVDVTQPRQYLRQHKARTGEALSFTAFLVTCVARAVDENRYMHAYRNWRNQIVIFDEVDVNTMIEREVGGHKMGTPCILRAVNSKTLRQIHDEIRAAQQGRTEEAPGMRWFSWAERLAYVPTFLRTLLWKVASRLPHTIKRFSGTVGITAVGMFAPGIGWGMTLPLLTLNVVVGGIAAKPGVVEGRIEIREYLHLTISVDHDVIDGATAARFVARLKELVASGYGLA